MPGELGYVDVTLGSSTDAPERYSFPFVVLIAPPLGTDPAEPDIGQFLAPNPIDLPPVTGLDVQVGALVRRSDATGQAVELIIAPRLGLVDAEISVRINTSVFSFNTDYGANPTPDRGESFVIFGCRSVGVAGNAPLVGAVVTVDKGTGSEPHDVTGVKVFGTFGTPTELFVGQQRARTAAAPFDPPLDPTLDHEYRRAEDGLADGVLVAVTAHDPGNDQQQWLHVDLTSPRAGDGPARPIVAEESPGAGGIPAGGLRRYQVTWVHQHGNETAPSPPSAPVGTTTGSVRVPLPVWVDPVAPGLLGPVAPEPIVGRRVYRTVTSPDGTAGEAFLVAEIDDNVATELVDDNADDALGVPLLTDLAIAYRHTLDREGLVAPANGIGSLRLKVETTSYRETTAGDRELAGTVYDVRLTDTPLTADISYTTRPTIGRPRVTWRASGRTGAARVEVRPVGVSEDQHIDAFASRVPNGFGVDFRTRSSTRLAVELGTPDDVDDPIDDPVGAITARVARTEGSAPPVSPRAVEVEQTPEQLRFSAREVRRFRLLIGLTHPTRRTVAALDDGVIGELVLARPDKTTPRSLRLLREEQTAEGRTRLMVRVGDLPDDTAVDVRPGDGGASTAAVVHGRLQRVLALFQDAAQFAVDDSSLGRRRDGVWVAVHDTLRELSVEVDGTLVRVEPVGRLRADLSLRSTVGLGPADFRVHQAQAQISSDSRVLANFPDDGAALATLPNGASGRLALSTRALGADPADPDRLVAVRATPQVKVDLRRTDDDVRVIDDATARWIGLAGFELPAAGRADPFRLFMTDARANPALRGHVRLLDQRALSTPWDLVKVRIADLPERALVRADTDRDSYRVEMNRRSGRVVVFAQPPFVPEVGGGAGQLVGVGLAKADADSLPAAVQIDLLGPDNDLQRSFPFNATPDAGWRHSGFRVKPDGELVVRSLQLATVGVVRPARPSGGVFSEIVPPTANWSNIAASLVRIAPEGADPPEACWLWTPAEPLPSPGSNAGDWEGLSSWIGFRIESPSLATLQVQAYKDQSPTDARFWNHTDFDWLLEAELQMKDYRGEVTVDADISPEGDDQAGPGQWYLRIPDGAPFSGQVVFGNTGGWISNRPRIFEPFNL